MIFTKCRRLFPLSALLFAIFSVPSLHADSSGIASVTNDIASMLSGTHSPAKAEKSDRGIFIDAVHCDKETSLAKLLNGQTGMAQEAELAALFQRILCAESDDGMGKINVKQFAENAADPFLTGSVFYSGMQELGDWSVELEDDDKSLSPRGEAYISMLGLTTSGPLSSISLWQTLSPEHVRVWFASFRESPSTAMTYDFELQNNRWVWVSAILSLRL